MKGPMQETELSLLLCLMQKSEDSPPSEKSQCGLLPGVAFLLGGDKSRETGQEQPAWVQRLGEVLACGIRRASKSRLRDKHKQ